MYLLKGVVNMNKSDFKDYLQNNLSEYDNFIQQGIDHFKKKYHGDSQKAIKKVSNIWDENVSTFYAVARAEILSNGFISWISYLEDNNILEEIDQGLSNADFSFEDDNETTYSMLDERGHQITTREGYTGFIDAEVKNYFFEKYFEQDWKVVAGHWPSMESKQDVDEWIESMNSLMAAIDKKADAKQNNV